MKPHNVFMTSQGSLKIGDFGLATSLARGKVTSRVGTPSYIAPEVLQYDGYGPPVDVWGVGCLAFEMMTLDFLYDRKGMLASDVQRKPIYSKELPPTYNPRLRDIVSTLLSADPSSRPTAANSLKIVEELIQKLGGATACYMHLQEQASGGSTGRGVSSSSMTSSWQRKTPSRVHAYVLCCEVALLQLVLAVWRTLSACICVQINHAARMRAFKSRSTLSHTTTYPHRRWQQQHRRCGKKMLSLTKPSLLPLAAGVILGCSVSYRSVLPLVLVLVLVLMLGWY